MIFIRDRYNDSVMFEIEADNFVKAVEKKVAERANLSGADLTGADLYGADLSRANLSRANLSGANLSRANLYGADLTGADLLKQDLTNTYYQVGHVIHSYNWGTLPDNLTLELMRRDALICGDEAMQKWADGGKCPFSGHIIRDFWFSENRALWSPGAPTMNDMELFVALCREKDIKI